MKKAILLLIFTGCVFCLSAQQTAEPVLTKTDYLRKAKGQRIAAWCTLGGGFAMAVGGVGVNLGAPWDGEHVNSGIWMVYAGVAAVLTSIPLFISAHKNKRRAAALAFTGQPVQWPGTTHANTQPALQLKLGIGNNGHGHSH